MTEFAVERWADLWGDPEFLPLFRAHYEEMAGIHRHEMPFGLDSPLYEAVDAAGLLVVVTAREAGRLVGYCVAVCRRHSHYPTLCGFDDMYYLTPSSRRGMVGVRLIQRMIDELGKRGSRLGYWHAKEPDGMGRVFERLGMRKIYSVYSHTYLEN